MSVLAEGQVEHQKLNQIAPVLVFNLIDWIKIVPSDSENPVGVGVRFLVKRPFTTTNSPFRMLS